MNCRLQILMLMILTMLPVSAKDQGVKGTVHIDADVPVNLEKVYVVLKHGPVWQNIVYCDSSGCFSIESSYTGDHRVKAFIDFSDEKNTDTWISNWVFIVVNRDKYTKIKLTIEKVKD